jgi:hypothetical protein
MEGYTQSEYFLIEDDDEDEDDDEEDLLKRKKKTKIKYSTILKEEEFIED